jgi:hypothetical protein
LQNLDLTNQINQELVSHLSLLQIYVFGKVQRKRFHFSKKNKTLSLSMLSSMAKSVFTNGPTKNTSHKRLFSLMKAAVLENFLIGGPSFFLWLWKKHSLPSYLKGNSAK